MSNVFTTNLNSYNFSVANTLPTGLYSLQSRLQFQNQNVSQYPQQQLNETVSNVNVSLAQPASTLTNGNTTGLNNLTDNGTIPTSGQSNKPVNSAQVIENAPLPIKRNL